MNLVVAFLFCFIVNSAIALDNVSNRRIVAMGDLHGDLSNTLSILKFSKIIDEDHHWIAGDTILVQTVRI